MSKPTFTDAWRRPTGYATAADSREPGYLQRRFEKIREDARIEKERAEAARKPIPFQRAGRRPSPQ